jgi:hypothetical protein
MASEMILPIIESLLADFVPTWAMALPATGRDTFLIDSTTASVAASIPRLTSIGFAPAVMALTPSRNTA